MQRCVLFVNRSSRGLVWFRFIGKRCFTPGSTDFSMRARSGAGIARRGGGGGGGGGRGGRS